MSTVSDLVADPDEALELCAEILGDLEELPEPAEDFAVAIEEKLNSMSEWIDTESRCTEAMATAILNMRRGVDK